MQYIYLYLLSFCLFLSQTCVYSQGVFEAWTKVKVIPDLPPNLPDKPLDGKLKGEWKLFFAEEFVPNTQYKSGVDEQKWNFAEMLDDGYCKGGFNTPVAEFVHAIYNPENKQDGLLKMDISAENLDTCRSKGSQIMTFSVHEDFKGYWFYPNSYMEIRVKYPADYNIGTGGFLYPAWCPKLTEIDLWETIQGAFFSQGHIEGNGNGKHDEYKQGYIWGESYDNPNFSCKSKTKVMDKYNRGIEMADRWWIFGLEWYEDKILFYLNNVLVRSLDLNTIADCRMAHGVKYYPPQPMALRITLENMRDFEIILPKDSTKSLYIDYIRVYQPTNQPIIQEKYIPKKLIANQGDNISVRYYPDIQYKWSSPAFDFIPKDMNVLSHCFCEMQWLSPKKDLTDGIYPVHLQAILTNGQTENHTWNIEYRR